MNTFVNQITLRNFSLLFLPFFFCLLSNAQEKETEEKTSTNHEVRLDVFHLIVLPGIDVSYEHLIDNLSSWGVTGFLNFDYAFSEGYRYEQFEISPYYRLYYGRKNTHNSGFFVQPFLSLTSGEYYHYEVYNTDHLSTNISYNSEKDFFGMAGGAVIGRKWVNEKRYTFEIHAGIGRYFVFESNGNAYHQDTAYPRINFAIGRRF